MEPSPLAQYFSDAEDNVRTSLRRLEAQIGEIADIDFEFDAVTDRASNHRNWFAGLLGSRGHGAFRAAARLAASGTLPEAQMALRGALEAVLYAYFIADDPAAAEAWLRRHDSEEHKKKVRSMFTIRAVLQKLAQGDASLATRVKEQYEATIDWGAHPNEKGLSSAANLTETSEGIEIAVHHLSGDEASIRRALSAVAESGKLAVEVLDLVFAPAPPNN